MPTNTKLAVAVSRLPEGNPGVPYLATVISVGGTAPLTWSVTSGALPAGLTLNSATGVISGTPTSTGAFSVTVQVTDSSSPAQTATSTLSASLVTPGPNDPKLPQVFLDTTFPDTTSYTVATVAAGGDLQSAINNASCNPNGTVIRLAQGATFTATASYTLPNKSCAPGQWIIIRTDTADNNLPAPGVRISPSFSPTLAKIFSSTTSPAIQTLSNANHYWFMGVELGVPDSVTLNYGIVFVGSGETSLALLPNHIYLDRCYIHGNSLGGVKAGLVANGSAIAAVNSYFENFHLVGQDSQAIQATNSPGPLKIANNFLEGAGENIILGGADPRITNLVQSDVEIRQNSFFKPLSWRQGDPSYAGTLWTVKNLLELKNAQRVLVEGNVLKNNWAQAQTGFGVLFTPRNQAGACTWCVVADVTFRYNAFLHSANGYNISAADAVSPNGDGAGPSLPSQRISIHDNLMADINGPAWNGSSGDGTLLLLINGPSGAPAPPTPPQYVTFTHNTSFQTAMIISLSNNPGNPLPGFVFTNNIQPHNVNGVFGGGTGTGNLTLTSYFTSVVFTANVLDNLGDGNCAPGCYSSFGGNFFPPDWPTVQFVNYTGDTTGDYHLGSLSPYLNGGTDGTDIGANIDAIEETTIGIIP